MHALYDWEIASDTKTTWRIGDGTASFYNYIYYCVAGFCENDTFRSNQIREGMIGREEALELVNRDNQPRFDSIQWYCNSIQIDMVYALKTINAIPKLY
jgi:glucosamine--fructose-6-phosphate aminotransferase (isomerizing)